MIKQLLFLVLTTFVINTYSQYTFEKAYFIKNSGERTECLIRNKDWGHNPSQFAYRENKNAQTKNATIKEIKEFGVYNYSVYRRYTVNIDRSSNNITKLEIGRRPMFEEDTVFLKVLVEGEANLFSYSNIAGDMGRYFYNIRGTSVVQLIYKRYFMKNADDIMKNERYKQQLKVFLDCDKIMEKDLLKTDYNLEDLVNLFLRYNQCDEPMDSPSFVENKNVNVGVKLGVRNASYVIENDNYLTKGDFGEETSISLGIDIEFIFPFIKKRLSFFTEPTYQYYKPDRFLYLQTIHQDYYTSFEYKSIEIPFGFRYHFPIRNKSKLFLEAAGVADYPIDSKMIFEHRLSHYKSRSSFNFSFGTGYKYSEKYSFVVKYGTGRPVMSVEPSVSPSYKYFSAALGYTVF